MEEAPGTASPFPEGGNGELADFTENRIKIVSLEMALGMCERRWRYANMRGL
jgi:hypothetical protein